jgi:hypothetical protein
MPNAIIIYGHNTGNQIHQLEFRVNLVHLLSNSSLMLNTQHNVAGQQKHSAIGGKAFHPQSSTSLDKINTAEEVCGMHQTQMAERHKVLVTTVGC